MRTNNNITLLTEDFLGARNGFVTYKGSSHKLIPYNSRSIGRIYIAPQDRTIIVSPMASLNRKLTPKSILMFDRIGLEKNEWIKISRMMASSY